MRGDARTKPPGAAKHSILDSIMSSAPSTQRVGSGGGRARNHACSNCRAAKASVWGPQKMPEGVGGVDIGIKRAAWGKAGHPYTPPGPTQTGAYEG
jgi:hypothetical protein